MSSVSAFNIVPNVVKPKSSATETVQWGLSIFGNPALANYGFLLGVQDVGYGETGDTGYWNCITPPPPASWMVYENVGNGANINIRQAQNTIQLIQIAKELVPASNPTNRHEATEALINNNYFCPNFDMPDFQTYGLIGGFLTGWTPCFDADNSGYYPEIYGYAYLDMTQQFPDGNNQPINLDLQDAVIFDGTNYLYMANTTDVPQGTAEFTASIWFKAPNVTTEQTLFAWGNTGTAGEYVRLYISGGELIFTTGDGFDASTTISTDTWYNAAIQGIPSAKYLYLDGVQVDTNSMDFSVSGQDVYIGATNDTFNFFTGSINNFLIYNVFIGSDDIYWNAYNMRPVVDKAAVADDFTIEWYMKPTNATTFPRVFSFGAYPTAQNAVSIESGTIIWWANSGARLFASNPNPYDGNWHHVAITRNVGVVSCWFDGVSYGTTFYADGITTIDNLMIGTQGTGTTPSGTDACFDGLLTNFEYTVGLSKYNNTFTPPTAPLTSSVPFTKLLDLQSTTDLAALLLDQSGNGNNGTAYNSPTTNVSNPFADSTISLELDSTSQQYVVILASNSFNISGGGATTSTTTTTTTAAPTTTSTTTSTTTALPEFLIGFGGAPEDACGSLAQGTVTGDNVDFCSCTTFTGAILAAAATGTWYVAFSGNVVSVSITNGNPVATVTSSCSVCSPLTTTTTTSTTTASPTTSTTSTTTAAPTTSTTTSTTTAAPTTTSTTTSTTTAGDFNIGFGGAPEDACGFLASGTVSGDNVDFCSCTTLTGSIIAAAATGTWYVSFGGNVVSVSVINGNPVATVTSSCSACSSTSTTTTTTTAA